MECCILMGRSLSRGPLRCRACRTSASFTLRTTRTADVHADTAVECLVLPAATLDRMGASHPALKMAILVNLLRNVHQVVGRLDRQVTALST